MNVSPRGRAVPRRRQSGFTLVELMVVVAIIAVIAAGVIVVGSSVLDGARARSTRATITLVDTALDQFHEEKHLANASQIASGTPSKVYYKDRYGIYPPDELEVFTGVGIPGGSSPRRERLLLPDNAHVMPDPTDSGQYGDMTFQHGDLALTEQATEHRDLAAMIVAIETYSPAGRGILDKISDAHRAAVPYDRAARGPVQYVDTNRDDRWTAGKDREFRYIVDDWGVPLVYYAQRDAGGGNPVSSRNHATSWNRASTLLVRLNNDRPVIMSWGPNGRDQLTADVLDGGESTSLLHVDLADNDRLDDSWNKDNIFADDTLLDRLEEERSP